MNRARAPAKAVEAGAAAQTGAPAPRRSTSAGGNRGALAFNLAAVPVRAAAPVAPEEERLEDDADRLAHRALAGDRGPPEPPARGPLGPRVQRAAAEEATERGGGLVVDDDAPALMPGQMRKSALLARLREEGCAAADRELARAGRDTRGCPHVERWLTYYQRRAASQVERAIRKLVPAAADVRSAADYVPLVSARLARGARTWAETGRLPDDLPAELRAQAAGSAVEAVAGALGAAVGGAVSALGRLLFKRPPGAAAGQVDAAAVAGRLGPGRPLDGGPRARMEEAFGQDFGQVRVHDDPGGSALARALEAHAFTLGEHVVFAEGRYRPGTPMGDALLAHELAHVVQQGGAQTSTPQRFTEGQSSDGMEADADQAALGAVLALHAPGAADEKRSYRPRLRGGLRLSRCGGSPGRRELTLPREAALAPATSGDLAGCTGSPLRIEVRKPETFAWLGTPLEGLSTAAGIQIIAPAQTTRVSQHEQVRSTLTWQCPGGGGGTETADWEHDWANDQPDTIDEGKLAVDGHVFGLCCGAGHMVRDQARRRGFDPATCDFILVEVAVFDTTATAGDQALHHCRWGFRFEGRVVGGTASGTSQASVRYRGVDLEETMQPLPGTAPR